MALRAELAAALLLVACADIRVDPIGECGNNVVEPGIGEDCDLIVDPELGDGLVCGPADGSPTACRYLCTGDAICPPGWACFDDRICRYPTMRFEEEEEPRLILRADQIEVAPFSGEDHDEIAARLDGDLFVFDVADEEGETARFQISLADPRGELIVLPEEDDRAPRVVMPAGAPDGLRLHLLGLSRGRFITSGAPRRPFSTGEVLRHVVTVTVADSLLYAVERAGDLWAVLKEPGCEESALLLGDASLALARPAVRGRKIALAIGTDRILIAESGACELRAIAELVAPRATGGADLLDLDGDGRPDALAYLEGERIAVALGTDAGFGPMLEEPAFDLFDEIPEEVSRECGGERLVLATGDLNADRIPDFVTEDAIFVSRAPFDYRRAYVRARKDAWIEAVMGDFDRDGYADVVATAASRTIDCEPTDMELIRGSSEGDFRAQLIGDVSAPSHLRASDFDGDGILDLLLAERATDANEQVSVFYGETKEALEEKASVGGFEVVVELEAFVREEQVLNPDRVGDLFVASAEPELFETIIAGDPKRTLLSPFPIEGAGRVATAAGPLFDPAREALLIVSSEVSVLDGESPRGAQALAVEGLDLRPCSRFLISRETGAVFGVDGYLDRNPEILERFTLEECDYLGAGPSWFVGRASAAGLSGRTREIQTSGRAAKAVLLSDLNRNGEEDLVVLFAFDGGERTGRLEVLFDAETNGGPFERLLAGREVLGVTALDADSDDDEELAVMTGDGVLLLDFDEGSNRATESELVVKTPDLELENGPVALRTGDLNGDDLDDLVLLYGEGLFVFPAVPNR